MAIKFGTDGWRERIAEEYTFKNVRRCAKGTASYLKHEGLAARVLIVGYDTRFASKEFAAAVAEVTTANGVPTFLCDKPAPTPVVSYNLVTLNAGGGVVITASHNPWQWNGFKYKPTYGGSASPEVVEELEKFIAADYANNAEMSTMSLEEAHSKGLLEYIDPEPPYLSHISTLVDIGSIRKAGLKIVVDSMYGAGAGYFAKLLSGDLTEIIELHGEHNPSFPGISQPEPLAHNLNELMSVVPAHFANIGLATDGDADRLGVVDENGKFITTLETFALLCFHHLEVLNIRGPIVRSLTMTNMIDRLAELYGVSVFDTEVGFKYLGPVMMAENAMLAGEESGGYAIRGHIPERDGILSGLLILDMMVKTGKTISQLLEMLIAKVGPHHYDRWDIKFLPEQRAAIHSRLRKASPHSLAGKRVDKIDTRDGYRFVLEGGYWALIRFSGTEPLLRIYAETESPDNLEKLLKEARDIAGV